MSETHLRQPGFTYSACGPFTKKKDTIRGNRRLHVYLQEGTKKVLSSACSAL